MSVNIPINQVDPTAPTPQNTPLTHAPIAQGLSRPTVPDITEGDEGEEAEELGGTMQQAMLGLVHGKLTGLVGKSSGYVESLPVEVKKNVEALKGVQVKQVELQNQYKRECLELEKKPLYDRRLAIITGTAPPTAEEIEAGEKASLKDDPDYVSLPDDVQPSATGIPEFWLTALRTHVHLGEIITDRDAEALKSLKDVRLEYLPSSEPRPGFKILFHFGPNEFFENEVLEKTYLYQEEVGYSGDFMYDRAVGTEIKWKEEKDLTKKFEVKRQRNKNTNRTRLIRKARPIASFFNFFSPPSPPSPELVDSGDMDEDELEELEEKLEIDYQLGEDFKEKIIPRAVDYFTGKALEYEDSFDDDDEFEDMDDDEDDEDDFEDDDSDDDDIPARRRGPPKGRGAGGNQSTDPEECKQQ
ncbi:nucleosome assembly protein [Epithele typhae]|uniref:nucleosome assembly protein n=1 Tax=Epithele typhae TaxID=378194 RepID=UPI002007D300|nr:nucleosome assembly protein [Epithele typhae]KAH9920506.1 nucleosome assembly protein [Epithele typhae]